MPAQARGTPVSSANSIQRAVTDEGIRRSREFLEQTIDNLPLVITVNDARDQRFIMLSRMAERYWGVSRVDAIGEIVADLFGEERARRVAERDKAALEADGPIYFGEHRAAGPGGQARMFSARRIAMRYAQDQPIYIIGVMEDVT